VEEARDSILERIDDFIEINFVLHPKAISETANKKIQDSDVILTFSHSKLVERVLLDAAKLGKSPRVILAEARSPGLPAQATARGLAARLTAAGLHTTYLLLTALDLVLPEVTLVLLGCEVRSGPSPPSRLSNHNITVIPAAPPGRDGQRLCAGDSGHQPDGADGEGAQ
jgi:translation initiation factor 2B subunit (eIF-2B alpha/beta/delta family)